MKKRNSYRNILSIISIFLFVSCFGNSGEGNDLAIDGWYASPETIVQKYSKRDVGYREHFMLGISYRKLKKYKKALFHFANSAFKYKRNTKLKLFPYPVYKFLNGYHFKSELYDDAVYAVADLFNKYREFKYVVKYTDLIGSENTALFRDTVLLKSKALMQLKKYEEALDALRDISDDFDDAVSQSIIHIRIASIYEKMKSPEDAVREYMTVIDRDAESWQSSLSVKRVQKILGKVSFLFNPEQKLNLARALYFNAFHDEAIKHLTGIIKSKPEDDKKLDCESFLVRSYVRKNMKTEASAIIAAYRKDSIISLKLRKAEADELWSMRKRDAAVALYQSLLNSSEDTIAEHAHRRTALHLERRKRKGFQAVLERYVKTYPDNPAAEYLLWLLAKNRLKSADPGRALLYLESAVKGFPEGRYSDRIRFWIYKIYRGRKNSAMADRFARELIALNPGSTYTWAMVERISKRSKREELKQGFSKALENDNIVDLLYFNTILLHQEKNTLERNKRRGEIPGDSINRYESFESDLRNMNLGSDFKDNLKELERYFKIGYYEAIHRELFILPDTDEAKRNKYITLSFFGDKYNNHYLTTLATLELLKHDKLKENFSLFSLDIIKRLLPNAFNGCVRKYTKRYKVDEHLVYSVLKAESLFNHRAVSSAGAVGLMQLMPATARGLARQLHLKDYYLKDPCTSIHFGVKYLSWLNKMFKGNFEDIMGGYNAGAGNIIKWKKRLNYTDSDYYVEMVPYEETRFYILRMRKFLIQYRMIYQK